LLFWKRLTGASITGSGVASVKNSLVPLFKEEYINSLVILGQCFLPIFPNL
jgi:hypothetical protein